MFRDLEGESRCRGLRTLCLQPRLASIGEHFDALPSVASATRSCMLRVQRGGRFQGAEQHVASLALFDAVVFKHPGLTNGVVQDGFFTHAHESAPPANSAGSGPHGLLGRGSSQDPLPSIPTFKTAVDGGANRAGWPPWLPLYETPSQSATLPYRTYTQQARIKGGDPSIFEE